TSCAAAVIRAAGGVIRAAIALFVQLICLLHRTLRHKSSIKKGAGQTRAALLREEPMIPGSFAYHRPSSVQEAVGLLTDLGDEARALAGGHSLIPMMKLRLATPAHLVDLAGVAELKGIRAEGNDIVVGAMTTQHDLVASDLLAARLPILRE